jgi:cell division protein FtsW (lipid II flippase)
MSAFLLNLLLATAQQYLDGVDDDQRSMERRLRLYAAAYMLLAVVFLLRATPSNGGAAITGFLLWVALLILSFVHWRFPAAAAAAAAAAAIAQGPLEPLFELLN